jgi:late competence protein required for DNA uptake (superfamily II DNA/RNA helicase)
MITRQQYLEALDVVETYHRQNLTAPKLTRIDQWDKLDECDMRLYNVLRQVLKGGQYIPYHQEFIELIDVKGLAKVRGAGQKSIDQFIELRGY